GAARPPHGGGARAAGEELRLQGPADSVRRALPPPAERIRRPVPERPANLRPRVVGPELDDVRTLCPAELAAVDLAHRIAPEEVPGAEAPGVDPQGAAVDL